MNTINPYAAPSDIDRHRRDREHLHADQHRLGCKCDPCSARRLDCMMFIAAKRGRDYFGSSEAVLILCPEVPRPAWMSC